MTDLSKLPIGTHTLPSGCVVTVSGPTRLPAAGSKRAGDDQPWGTVVSTAPKRIVLAFSIPARQLWPNGRPNRWERARLVREHRAAGLAAGSQAIMRAGQAKPWERATVQAAFHFADSRRRDADGALASLKSYLDGIVESGVLADDSTTHLQHLPATFAVDRNNPRVELTLERLG